MKSAWLTIAASLWLASGTHEATARVITQELTENLSMDIPMQIGRTVTMEFPDPVVTAVLGNSVFYTLKRIKALRWKAEIKPQAPGTNLNMGTIYGHVSMQLRHAGAGEDPVDHIKFVRPGSQSARAIQVLARQAVSLSEVTQPVEIAWHGEPHALILEAGPVVHGRWIVLPLRFHNVGSLPYPVESVLLEDQHGRPVDTSFHQPDTTGPQASTIAPDGTLQGAFVLDPAVQVAHGWSIKIIPSNSVLPASFRWVRQDAPPAESGPLEDRVALAVQALGGVTQLEDRDGQRAWIDVQGIGARLGFGIGEHTSLEVGLDYVRTGTASIGDDMLTHASAGRLQVGGLLHMGRQIIPYGRAGFGAFMAQHRFDDGGDTDTAFRVSGTLQLGGGVNWLVTPRFLVGVSAQVGLPFGNDEVGPVLEAGLHVGGLSRPRP